MGKRGDVQVESLYREISKVLEVARTSAYRAVNFAMVRAYWKVGRLVVEHEQGGRRRAAYGKKVLEALSRRLTAEFGRGFDVRNLRYMRQFYLAFPICHAPCDELESTEKRNASRSKSTDPPTDDAGDESSVAQSKPMLRPELSWTKGRPYPSQELLWRSSTISRKSLLSISSRGARAHTEKEVIGYLEKAGFVDAPTPSFPDR